MPTFTVTVEENVRYTMDIEADDEEAARAAAIDAVVQSPDPFKEFEASVEEREIFMVLPL